MAHGLCAAAAAQPTAAPAKDGWSALPARIRLDAERLKLPGGEHLGLVGTTYLIEPLPNFWFGPAAYGAMSGERGGLLVVGAEAAWQGPSIGPWSIGAGLFAGGGGGGSAPVGGGLMLRPHLDLAWAISPTQRLGLSWSRVSFPKSGDADARIDTRQLGLQWSIDTQFRYVPREGLGRRGTRSAIGSATRSGIGFDRVQPLVGFYRPSNGARRLDGGELPQHIGFAGARLEQAFGDGLYWGIEAAGAASGGVAGYAEYLATLGIETQAFDPAVAIGARVALGMGGGGSVDTGGGLLWKAGGYGLVHLTRDLGLSLEAGWVRAPQGRFNATYGGLALNWIVDERRASTPPAGTTRMEWVGGIEQYSAARRDGSTRALKAVVLRVNREVADGLYLSAQAHSATGGGAGGYSVGLLGMGWRTDLAPRWHAGVEALAGAAGGGGVDTAGGAVVQPMAYLGYDLQPGLALRLGGGRIQGLRGPLKGDVLEMSLAFTFGVASRDRR